ncbi:hypothetical protein EJB05_08394, partial [Eragrostis curvula]
MCVKSPPNRELSEPFGRSGTLVHIRVEGHNSRECSKIVRCEICRKGTHITKRCVWPKQTKPVIQIVGLAVDGLGFCSAQHAKVNHKKTRKVIQGLVKVKAGFLTAKQLEADFSCHFAWGKEWKTKQVGQDFLLQFPNKERLQELINFPELKLKGSGASVEVLPWSAQARAKARLHTVWVTVDNVPEEMLNYHAVLLELVVKPFIYDIYFKVESIVEEGWNAEGDSNPAKRISVEVLKEQNKFDIAHRDSKRHKGMDDIQENGQRTGTEEGDVQMKTNENQLEQVAKDRELAKQLQLMEEQKIDKNTNSTKEDLVRSANVGVIPVTIQVEGTPSLKQIQDRQMKDKDERVQLDDSQPDEEEEEVMDSQDDGGFAKECGVELSQSQEDTGTQQDDEFTEVKTKKAKGPARGETGKSDRLSKYEDQRVGDIAAVRAEAKDAFLQQGNEANPFTVLNTENKILIDIASKIGVNLGNDVDSDLQNIEVIKSLEQDRINLILQSNKNGVNELNLGAISDQFDIDSEAIKELLMDDEEDENLSCDDTCKPMASQVKQYQRE